MTVLKNGKHLLGEGKKGCVSRRRDGTSAKDGRG